MAAPFISHRMQRLHTDSGVVMALFWVQTPDREHYLAVTVCPACPPLLRGSVLPARVDLPHVSNLVWVQSVVELMLRNHSFNNYVSTVPACCSRIHRQNNPLTHSVEIDRHRWKYCQSELKESATGALNQAHSRQTLARDSSTIMMHCSFAALMKRAIAAATACGQHRPMAGGSAEPLKGRSGRFCAGIRWQGFWAFPVLVPPGAVRGGGGGAAGASVH